jgi:hypothetical protein
MRQWRNQYEAQLCLLIASCWFLAWLTLRHWRWNRHVPPKCQWAFNGLHSNISQKMELIIIIAVRTTNPTFTSTSFQHMTSLYNCQGIWARRPEFYSWKQQHEGYIPALPSLFNGRGWCPLSRGRPIGHGVDLSVSTRCFGPSTGQIWTRIAQSVQRLATGWTTGGSEF